MRVTSGPFEVTANPRRLLGISVLVVVSAGLTIATVGFPPFLFVLGTWLFAAGAGRSCASLNGPSSWVAGIVLEATFLTAESATVALVSPHPHGQWVYVVMLVVPLVTAGLAAAWFSTSNGRHRARGSAAISGEPLVALLVLVLVEATFELIKLRGHDFGLSWFMEGDARNQVVGTRQVLAAGGITLKEMTSYPAVVNAISAIFDGAGGRSGLSAGTLLIRDVQAMVATVVLICAGASLCLMAAIAETFDRGEREVRRLPVLVLIPLGVGGSVSLGALFLGLGSSGGFLSAMGCLVFAVASLVVGMRLVQRYDNATMVVATFAMFLVVGSWTFLVVVPGLALLVGVVRGVQRVRQLRHREGTRRELRLTTLVLAVSSLSLIGVAVALVLNGHVLVTELKNPGGIVAGNLGFFEWLGAASVLVVLVAPGARQRSVRLLVVAEFVVLCLVVLWMHSIHPSGVAWSYYATKMLWLATCTLVWVPFVLVVDALRGAGRLLRRSGSVATARVVLAVAGSGVLLWGINQETPYFFPVRSAFDGSTLPTPRMVQTVVRDADEGTPSVYWAYGNPMDDKLGDFWSALSWAYDPNGTLKPGAAGADYVHWAYAEQGTLTQLCQVVSEYRLRIVTTNPHLIPTLWWECKGYKPVASQARPPR